MTSLVRLSHPAHAMHGGLRDDARNASCAGAVNASGNPIYAIGSTSALAVNLEECTGCGDSGWGWRDDAWGTKGIVSTVRLRFSNADGPDAAIQIQTREDGVMIDQIVLSSSTYKTARPGAVKNDKTIVPRTPFY